ncbi:MAG: hypothetical protein Q8K58_15915 [Acidimicrobiales bacterium]|nr:hypothetical protein [Acidimicrobiales bacterium]
MLDEQQHARLLDAKLVALARPHVGDIKPERHSFPGGAALTAGSSAWLLLESDPVISLGPALVWADRRGAADVHLLTERAAGVLARRAALFSPAPTVWEVDGTAVRPATPDPVPVAAPAEPAPELASLLVDADLEVLVEDGLVRGELNGLEVARIVHGTSTAGMPLDEPLLEVGVGQADRELTAMLHGRLDPVDQLARVAEIVRDLRRPGAERHPLNQLVPERWLRARLLADPGRVGCARLRPVEAPIPRANLRERGVAVALGTALDDQPVVVACSVGIDLDLVPSAADARLALDPGARLVLVVPERDAHPVTRSLATRLVDPAELVALPGDWRE